MKDPMCKPCAAWGEKLSAVHPDDLSPYEHAEIESHVANCLACSAILAEYHLMDARIRNFPSPQFLLTLSPPPLKLFKTRGFDDQHL